MKKLIFAMMVLLSTAFLGSCAMNSTPYGTTYIEGRPGFTGYTVGEGSYNISNGYGPEFWNPGYGGVGGYNQRAWVTHGYYGGYRGTHVGGFRR